MSAIISVIFNIIGSGPDKSIFLKYVEENNLNVKFLGQRKRKELSEYYLSHDLFVFPSLHDSGGMVVLEAKAHGLPSVVSSFGGPKMSVGNGDVIINERNSVDKFIKELKEAIIT